MVLRRVSVALAALLGSCVSAPTQAPAPTVVSWAPAPISSAKFESHPAFDPVNGDFYFVRSSPQFTGWRLFVSSCSASGWTEPVSPPFAGDGVEADPWFAADGDTLYFISSRSVNGVKPKNLDIWKVARQDGAWGTPVRLPEPVNSAANEWFPRIAADGWLYFGSGRPGGLGKTDLWRARETNPGRWSVENLGTPVNTEGDEYEPQPTPDGQRLIFMADGGLYEARRSGAGWQAREKLGPQINVDGSEIGVLLSPSGNSMLFARDTHEPLSGEFFLLRGEEPKPWPPECPPSR